MRDQFFGKFFRKSLLILLAVFLFAILSYLTNMGLPILIVVALIVLIVSAKDPTLGLGLVFLELFSNPHGYLIFATQPVSISLRMAVFVGFFLGYVLFFIRQKSFPRFRSTEAILFLPLITAVIIGLSRGMMMQNSSLVFQDGNAYFYLLYLLPILSLSWGPIQKQRLLQILSAGVIWNIGLSFGILYLYSHFDESILRSSYLFLRDTRLAEITNLGLGVYRVFMQSQFFVFIFGLLLIPLFFQSERKQDRLFLTFILGGVIATILLSLSRSFWVGIIAALFALLILLWRSKYPGIVWKTFVRHLSLAMLISVCLIVGVSLFPFPSQRIGGNDLMDALKKRTESDVAVSSRWTLLHPMLEAIEAHPLLGNGFGTEVSFVTDDPRVRELNPDGIWSTYSMEWGWFELWIKMGLMGPVGFLFLFFAMLKRFLWQQKTDHSWLSIGFVCGLIFLFSTHFFSPYLNHPIGLGFILFTLIFLPELTQVTHPIWNRVKAGIPIQNSQPSSALSLQAESLQFEGESFDRTR